VETPVAGSGPRSAGVWRLGTRSLESGYTHNITLRELLRQRVYAALRAGASAFLLEDTRPHDLLQAIETVAAGDALLAPSITRRLIAEFAARRDPAEPPAALCELTDREREIMRLVAEGLSNAAFAGRLVISPLTAKTHVSTVLRKLGCRDRAALVAVAYETGLVSPGALRRWSST
jgi:DNA-binding NarL/FixJ family response regulator